MLVTDFICVYILFSSSLQGEVVLEGYGLEAWLITIPLSCYRCVHDPLQGKVVIEGSGLEAWVVTRSLSCSLLLRYKEGGHRREKAKMTTTMATTISTQDRSHTQFKTRQTPTPPFTPSLLDKGIPYMTRWQHIPLQDQTFPPQLPFVIPSLLNIMENIQDMHTHTPNSTPYHPITTLHPLVCLRRIPDNTGLETHSPTSRPYLPITTLQHLLVLVTGIPE